MKRMITILAAAVAVVCGCSKMEQKNDVQELRFNVTVADPDCGVPTKAVKKAWETNDKIIVFFREGSTGNFDSAADHQLVLRYDGSNWKIAKQPIQALTGGDFAALCFKVNEYTWTVENSGATIKMDYNGSERLAQPWYAEGKYPKYTIEDEVVTFAIELKHQSSDFQVVVPGLTVSDGYSLSIGNSSAAVTGTSTSAVTCYKQILLRTDYRISMATGPITLPAAENADGVAFFPSITSGDQYSASAYYFNLTKGRDRYLYTLDNSDGTHAIKKGMAIKLPAFDGTSENPVKWIKQ